MTESINNSTCTQATDIQDSLHVCKSSTLPVVHRDEIREAPSLGQPHVQYSAEGSRVQNAESDSSFLSQDKCNLRTGSLHHIHSPHPLAARRIDHSIAHRTATCHVSPVIMECALVQLNAMQVPPPPPPPPLRKRGTHPSKLTMLIRWELARDPIPSTNLRIFPSCRCELNPETTDGWRDWWWIEWNIASGIAVRHSK